MEEENRRSMEEYMYVCRSMQENRRSMEEEYGEQEEYGGGLWRRTGVWRRRTGRVWRSM